MLSVSTCCENIELAMKWIDVGYTMEGAYVSNYGVEGYSYDIGPDGTPAFTDLVMSNENLTVTEAISVYTPRFMAGITIVSASDCLYTVVTEATVKFIIRDRSLDEFDAFTAELEQMGIQECIDIKQAAYDRYINK